MVKRGDLVTVSLPGSYGKPRPAVIVQSNLIKLDSVILCPITSNIQALSFRLLLEPNQQNNLSKISQIMVDKLFTLPIEKISKPFGKIETNEIRKLERILMLILGIGEKN